jgi:DNA (cytosine-5)-methyltransferase 1
VLLENVDRLLKSPSKKRGRDFGIMLACFNELDYNVEWRVINAADYGYPQRRRRVFIFASRNNLKFAKLYSKNERKIVLSEGFFANTYKVKPEHKKEATYEFSSKDLVEISNKFSASFYNAGIMVKGLITTFETIPVKAKPKTLGDILDEVSNKDGYIIKSNLDSWKYLKGGKKIERTSKEGFKYTYSEGPIAFPDFLDKPSRTMLTSESSLNRSSHILFDEKIKSYRTLTPIEAERLNGFPDNWTLPLTDRRRFFMMGNALVTGLINQMAKHLLKLINQEN